MTNLAVARLVQRVRVQRNVTGKKPRFRARPPRVPFPGAIERRYRNILLHMVERMIALVNERLIPKLPKLSAEVQALLPARMDDWVSEAESIMAGILEAILEDTGDADDIARGIAFDVSDQNMAGFQKQLKVVFGTEVLEIPQPWLKTQFDSFAVENSKLVTSIPEEYVDRLRGIIQKEFAKGTDHREIAKDIQETFDIPRNKAKLIARDQVGSLNGTLTQLRNQELGISSYRWVTAGDERVRPTHRARDGEVFRWDNPPPDGNPGQPINCRCVSLPVVEDLLAKVAS
jgi:SPP1 gp7 family putative phage head morphogenesis protein